MLTKDGGSEVSQGVLLLIGGGYWRMGMWMQGFCRALCTHLRREGLNSPAGLDEPRPVAAWEIKRR